MIVMQRVGQVKGFGQAQTYDTRYSDFVQELMVKACVMPREEVDGMWGTKSKEYLVLTARKYGFRYNYANVVTGTQLKRVRISPAGFITQLKEAIEADPQKCFLTEPRLEWDPTTRPTTLEPKDVPPATETLSQQCQQLVAAFNPLIQGIDTYAILAMKMFGDYKKGLDVSGKETNIKQKMTDFIAWWEKEGKPGLQVYVNSYKACGRPDLANILSAKITGFDDGIKAIKAAIKRCDFFMRMGNERIAKARKLRDKIRNKADKERWGQMRTAIAEAEKSMLPMLRGLRDDIKAKGCGGEGTKMVAKLQTWISRLRRVVKAGRRKEEEWQAAQEVPPPPPPIEEEEVAPPIVTPEEEKLFEEDVGVTLPVPVEEEEEEEVIVTRIDPWPWVLGGAALVFGVTAIIVASERRKKKEGGLAPRPATARWDRWGDCPGCY